MGRYCSHDHLRIFLSGVCAGWPGSSEAEMGVAIRGIQCQGHRFILFALNPGMVRRMKASKSGTVNAVSPCAGL